MLDGDRKGALRSYEQGSQNRWVPPVSSGTGPARYITSPVPAFKPYLEFLPISKPAGFYWTVGTTIGSVNPGYEPPIRNRHQREVVPGYEPPIRNRHQREAVTRRRDGVCSSLSGGPVRHPVTHYQSTSFQEWGVFLLHGTEDSGGQSLRAFYSPSPEANKQPWWLAASVPLDSGSGIAGSGIPADARGEHVASDGTPGPSRWGRFGWEHTIRLLPAGSWQLGIVPVLVQAWAMMILAGTPKATRSAVCLIAATELRVWHCGRGPAVALRFLVCDGTGIVNSHGGSKSSDISEFRLLTNGF
jgi:hypothetical protein